MRQSVFNQGHANQILLGGLNPLFDRQRHLARFAGSKTDVARFIADHHQGGKRQILPALHDFRYAINRNNLVLQIEALESYSLFGLSHLLFLPLASLAAFALLRFGLAPASAFSPALSLAGSGTAASDSTTSSLLSPEARAASVKALTRPW